MKKMQFDQKIIYPNYGDEYQKQNSNYIMFKLI